MKRISSYLFTLMAFACFSFMTGCGEDTEVDPTETLPEPDGTVQIDFTNFPGANPSANVATEDIVTISVRMLKGTQSGATRPQKLRIYETNTLGTRGTQVKIPNQGNSEGTIDLRNVDEQTKTVDYTVPTTASSTVYLYFEVDESGGKFSRKVLKLNVGTGDIISLTGKVLGGQLNPAGSRIASTTGDVYTVCDVPENIKFIDITYAVFATPTLLSNPQRATEGLATATTNSPCQDPANPDSGNKVNVQTGGGRNTYFATVLPTVNFTSADDAALNALVIPTSGAGASQKITVANGGTYAFVNSDGKKGLIKVTALEPGTSGKITLDIKVQR